jgi:endonuclease/exonuclease/phosphatase family protein
MGMSLTLLAWNLGGSGTSKHQAIQSWAPDVAVLPEYLLSSAQPAGSTSWVTFGQPHEKGLAIATFGNWKAEVPDLEPLSGSIVGGLEITGSISFRLVAVWAMLAPTPRRNPVVEAVEDWADWLSGGPVVVAGDFNTGGQWKGQPAGKSHYRILDALGRLGLVSAYHLATGEAQGEESMPTHFHHSGDCHIDHIFIPATWELSSAVVLERQGTADHAPMIVKVGESSSGLE